MNDWEKFNYISLTEKEDFYSHLNMEDITNAENKKLGKHNDLYVQNNTLC